MVLETERLAIRSWKAADKIPFAALNADPVVMKYFPSCYSREQSDAMVDICNDRISQDGFSFWAVERKDTGLLIGAVGLSRFDMPLPFCPCVEIGWRLSKDQWGKGFATEAANKCLATGFDHFGINEIVAFTALQNTPSRAVMERIGMRNTQNNFDHPNVPEASGLRTHCLYKISKLGFST